MAPKQKTKVELVHKEEKIGDFVLEKKAHKKSSFWTEVEQDSGSALKFKKSIPVQDSDSDSFSLWDLKSEVSQIKKDLDQMSEGVDSSKFNQLVVRLNKLEEDYLDFKEQLTSLLNSISSLNEPEEISEEKEVMEESDHETIIVEEDNNDEVAEKDDVVDEHDVVEITHISVEDDVVEDEEDLSSQFQEAIEGVIAQTEEIVHEYIDEQLEVEKTEPVLLKTEITVSTETECVSSVKSYMETYEEVVTLEPAANVLPPLPNLL